MSINFETEIKIYNYITKKDYLILSKLSLFFKNLIVNGLKYIEKSKKSLEEFLTELKGENLSTSYIKCLANFSNSINQYFDKIKNIYQNINNQCVIKINDFLIDFKNGNNEQFNGILEIDNSLKEPKVILEKSKNDYFNSAKILSDFELKMNQNKDKKEGELMKKNSILERHKKIMDKMEKNYLMELNKYNKYSIDIEKKYFSKVNKIYIKQQKKIELIYEIVNNFKKEIINLEQSNAEIINSIESINKSKNIDRDIGSFKDDYNFCDESGKRIILEVFLDYNIYKKNIEEEKEQKRILYKKVQKKDNEENKISEQSIGGIIQKIFNDKEKLNNEKAEFLMNYLNSDNPKNNNHLKFLQILMEHYKEKKFIKINIQYNFLFFKKIIELLINKNSNNFQEFYHEHSFLIKLAENLFYLNKENYYKKYYLCDMVYDLKIFSNKKFWINLLNFEIKMVTKKKIKSQIKQKEKNKIIKGNLIEKINSNKIKDKPSNNSNKKVENQIIYRIMVDDNLSSYCIEVIEEYIQHFFNFNLPKKLSMEIIKEIYNKYEFDKIYYEYFINEIISNGFIKKNSHNNLIKDINENNDKYIIIKEDNSKDWKLNLLIYSIYNINLDFNDFLNIIKLNKEYYKFLKKVIYKKILLKSPIIEFNKKIKIWKIILDYNENKKQYNYQDLKIKIKQNPNNPKDSNIIKFDVQRTFLILDKEKNKNKISNILETVDETIPEISYNQGMNYVATFLFNMMNLKKSEKENNDNEEETFYLFLGLFTSTKYGDLFKNNLKLLKNFILF